MSIDDTIRARRSIREFTDRSPGRDEIEALLEVARHAPNHRHTDPCRFYVLGPEARRAYGAALGARKAKRIEDPDTAAAVLEKVAAIHQALPCMIAVAIVRNDNPEIHLEDFATAFMTIQNLSLAAEARGLGTHIKTGAVMDDPRARAAVGLPDVERIVAIVNLGEPAARPEPKPRAAASEHTRFVP